MTAMTMSSLTRISDLEQNNFDTERVAKEHWETGDYVVGEITGPDNHYHDVELASGRMALKFTGDHIVGALGDRAATLEAVGSWSAIEEGQMHAMTSAGLFGVVTSRSMVVRSVPEMSYVGHVLRNGKKVAMPDFAIKGEGKFAIPTILLVGTSMSAGKTTAGRLIVRELHRMGKTVVGAKLTGAGRYRDVMSFRDAGAKHIFDFVDAGLPSTVVPEQNFRHAIRPLLHHINTLEPDVLVAEAGASPLEPYNGAVAIEELGSNITCIVLCASDPYAVVGVQQAFGIKPDLVTGPAASTSAAIDLVTKLTNVDALNVLDSGCVPKLRTIITKNLN